MNNNSPELSIGQKMKKLLVKIFLFLTLVPLLLFAGYTAFTLKFVYAKGERAGYLQKFSQKGWVFKTWEGELAMVNLPGAMPEIFYFTVRSPETAQKISQHLGQRVNVYYDQHRGIPGTWFGDTQYFVNDINIIPDTNQINTPKKY